MITNESVGEQLYFAINESSQVAEARRRVSALAAQTGMDETRAGICAVIVSEMGTNLIKHATDGEIFIRSLAHPSIHGVEILAVDHGPGIANLSRALQDGHSMAGSSGTGLGAMRRMASEFDIQSVPGRGTAVVARIWNHRAHTHETSPVIAGVINRARPGETVSGDTWMYASSDRRMVCAIADGLGHGPLAAQASTCAIESIRSHRTSPLAEQISRTHGVLRTTRGVALGIAEILHDRQIVKFAGIGNIMAVIIENGTTRHMVSHNGILGHQMSRVTEFQYPWSESAILIMCSDGISTHWDLKSYDGLLNRDPSLIAAVLYRDFTRGRDDTTVMVYKHRTTESS